MHLQGGVWVGVREDGPLPPLSWTLIPLWHLPDLLRLRGRACWAMEDAGCEVGRLRRDRVPLPETMPETRSQPCRRRCVRTPIPLGTPSVHGAQCGTHSTWGWAGGRYVHLWRHLYSES